MIRFSFISSFLWLLVACNSVSDTVVSVHVEGAKPDSKIMLSTKDSVYSGALDSLGMVKFVLDREVKPGYASVNYQRMSIPVYVEAGQGFDLAIQIEGRKVTPVFTGEGAKKNEYLNHRLFNTFRPDFQKDEDAFIADLEQFESQLNGLLDSMAFDSRFNGLEKKRIHYMVYGVLPIYPDYHTYYSRDTAYKTSDRFYEVLETAIKEEADPMNMREYMEAMEGKINMMATKEIKDYDGLTVVKSQLAYVQQNIKNPELAEYFTDRFATQYVDRSGVDHLADITPIYNEKVTSVEKKAAFDALCAKWGKVAKGQPSEDFKYLDINGKEVSLADLAGKYVYIDVWATWCGPCRGELPHLKKLEHQFKDKNIHFVSISCDQNKAAWEKMVKEDKLGGIQLHVGEDESFMDFYMIRSIPRFILLDKEGKIVEANMSRPSAPKTIETFNSLEGI